MKEKTFYITTPIYYVNAKPHLGHAYTTIIADIVNRYHIMKGEETYFLTGTDEHGDKIIRAAKDENMSPREYVDRISQLYKDLWPQLNIKYSHFIRTTDPSHIQVVNMILQRIYDAGDIYFSEYEGLYCFGCERFITQRELIDGKCPDHETEPDIIKESNYFFKMSKYQNWLIDYIQNHPDFIRPERYKNEVLGFLREPLEDLCISRPKTRLQWGITLPFDEQYVTYVWFDALLNYVSALGYPDGDLFKKFWPSAQHIVAKDILKPHGIYWPIMLKAAGIDMYQHLNVHGYWNVDHSKMSKSLGNVIEPLKLTKMYGLDQFRYFLVREMAFGLDSNFSESALVQRINSDLANDLGNLTNRVLAMVHKYFGGVVPNCDPEVEKELQFGLKSYATTAVNDYETAMDSFAFHKAVAAVWEFINQMNKYIDVTAPWELAKKKKSQYQLQVVMYHLMEGLRIVSGLIYPIMPDSAYAMQRLLGLSPTADKPLFTLDMLKKWKSLPSGTQIPKTTILFPRIEQPSSQESEAEDFSKDEFQFPDIKPEISIDTFSKIDLRVATVVHAEAIPKARKLLKLEVDIGNKRTVVAGIASAYKPEELIGKQVVVVANLKPVKIMGVLSHGMILAAVNDLECSVISPEKKIKNGTPVS